MFDKYGNFSNISLEVLLMSTETVVGTTEIMPAMQGKYEDILTKGSHDVSTKFVSVIRFSKLPNH